MTRRRDLFKGAALGALAAAGGLTPAQAAPAQISISDQVTYPGVTGKLLVNKPRAYEVMEEMKVDGLVALNPINVYYLANTLPVLTKFRGDWTTLATFPRDPQQPSFIVTSGAQTWDLVNGDREVPEIIAVTGPANWQEFANAGPEQRRIEPKASSGGYAVREGALTEREQRWAAAQKKYNANAAATPAWGLARALKNSGLSKGRIAVDDMRIKLMLDEIGMTDVTCVPGTNIFRRIRMVKSEPEMALMRIAGANNAIAGMNTIKAIQKGMRFEEVERRFQAECAALGNEMTSLLAGVTIGLFPDGHAVEGKPFLIDAVSHFRQYHGDFSRTVCLGEPSKEILARAKATKIGRDAVFEKLKAGMPFSEIRRIAFDAQVKAGMRRETLIVNPHSVGLEHGDNPMRLDGTYGAPIDTVCEENMVITVDMPYVEVGFGAGHHEDLIRITKTGYEPLHPEGDPLVVV
jgi:Xaa-Pro aminopeptidase